jgi:4-amino-4-deoxy-L-arabinose transferase-like glycosyltransferase
MALAALAAVPFLAFLGRAEITGSHEARVAVTARTMADAGWPWAARAVDVPVPVLGRVEGDLRLTPSPDGRVFHVNPWLVPVYDRQIRLQKPPLPYWCAAVLMKLIDDPEWAARLTPAALGALAALLLYDLGRRLFNRRVGLLAGLVWVSSHFVITEYRKAMADPYLAFFVLSAAWAWVAMAQRDPRRPRGDCVWLLACFYGSLALGFLAKGPVIVVHVGLVIAAHWFTCRRRPMQVRWWQHLIGILAVLLAVLPWPLYVMARVPQASAIWRYESVGELLDNTFNARPWYFYLPMLFQISLPWTPLWIYGMAHAFTRRRRRLWLAPIWYIATVAFFSLVHLKKNAYLLPMLPAQCLLVAQTVQMMLLVFRRLPGKARPLDGLALIQRGLGGAFGATVAGLILWDLVHARGGAGLATASSLAVALRLVAAVLSLGLGWLALKATTRHIDGFARLCACYAFLLTLFLALPGADRQNRHPPIIPSSTAGRPTLSPPVDQ